MSTASESRSVEIETPDADLRDAVLRSFRSVKSTTSDPQAEFNAALETYCRASPFVAVPVARHAVARILATAGVR